MLSEALQQKLNALVHHPTDGQLALDLGAVYAELRALRDSGDATAIQARLTAMETRFNWTPGDKGVRLTVEMPGIATALDLARRWGARVTFDPAEWPGDDVHTVVPGLTPAEEARARQAGNGVSIPPTREIFLRPLDTYPSEAVVVDVILHELAHTAQPVLGMPDSDDVSVAIVNELYAEATAVMLADALGLPLDRERSLLYLANYALSVPDRFADVVVASAIALARYATEVVLGNLRPSEGRQLARATLLLMATGISMAPDESGEVPADLPDRIRAAVAKRLGAVAGPQASGLGERFGAETAAPLPPLPKMPKQTA